MASLFDSILQADVGIRTQVSETPLELSVALNAWHARIPDYRIADGVELVYSGNPRAPHKLPLVWS